VVLPSGQKQTLGLVGTITLEVIPFRGNALFTMLLLFFKCILEVVFCEGVQHCLRFCLHQLNYVKMVASQFYLQLGKQRKVGWMGDDSHVVFGQTAPGEKGSVRQCTVMLKQPVLLSPNSGV
jgi:hypothetical protein